MQVETQALTLSPAFMATLSRHLVLLYTGHARLARDLLQTVLRSWYARNPTLVATLAGLTSNAELCASALEGGDLVGLGACLSTYWEQKKCVAEGCEPEFVTEMLGALTDMLHGASLAGAGGGGFMVLITKAPDACDAVCDRLVERGIDTSPLTFHQVEIDLEGLTVHVEMADS
jgi:fucokinase